jgi:hypothetical protein
VLDKKLDGEHYKLSSNQLYFKVDGQYDNSTLIYRVYDNAQAVVACYPTLSSLPNLINSTQVQPGDNRYTLDASSLASGAFVLEVINEKNEKMYLRFKK